MASRQITKADGATVFVGGIGATDTCEHCLQEIRCYSVKTGTTNEVWTGPDGLVECQPHLVGWRDLEHEPIGCIFSD